MDTMFKSIYALRQGFNQLFRNRIMSTASIFSISAVLVILGIFFILVLNVNQLVVATENQFDSIQIYVEDDVTLNQINNIEELLTSIEEVEEVNFVSKQLALENMREKWGENGYLLEGLESNPLPDSYVIKIDDVKNITSVVGKLKGVQGIEDVKYYKDVVDKLLGITNFIQMIGIVIILILILVSVFIVSNTIKLTVAARESEINIMKYVGATNWFIRGPFLIEGVIIGLFGTIISLCIVGFGYYKLVNLFNDQAIIRFQIYMVPTEFLVSNLAWIFIALGVGIGAIGSIMSMRKFLNV